MNYERIRVPIKKIKAPNGAPLYWAEMTPMDIKRSVTEDGMGKFINAGDHWSGGSYDDVIEMLRTGALSEVAKMQKLERKILEKLSSFVVEKAPRPSVYGGAVVVAAALSGHPKAFRRRQAITRPGIRVVIDLSFSSGFSFSEIQKNIVAYLTVAKLLSKTHNVELILCFTSEGNSGASSQSAKSIVTVPVGVSPFSWAQLAALTHCATYRQWAIGMTIAVAGGEIGIGGGLPSTNLRRTFSEPLKLRPTDLCLNGMLLGETKPETWVQEQLDRVRDGKHVQQ